MNYRPISVFSVVTKIFWKLISSQLFTVLSDKRYSLGKWFYICFYILFEFIFALMEYLFVKLKYINSDLMNG